MKSVKTIEHDEVHTLSLEVESVDKVHVVIDRNGALCVGVNSQVLLRIGRIKKLEIDDRRPPGAER